MGAPLINGVAYSHAQIQVKLLNGNVASVSSISYKDTQTKTNNYGAGNKPVSRGNGKIEYEASVTMDMTDIEAIRNTVTSRNLVDIAPFDILVTYLNGAKTVTHILKNAEFGVDGSDSDEDNTNIKMELELIISNIERK